MQLDDPLLKLDTDGNETRLMNAAEIKERNDLYFANTASSIIRRARSELAKGNGHVKPST